MGIYLVDLFGNEMLLHARRRAASTRCRWRRASAAGDSLGGRSGQDGRHVLRGRRVPRHGHGGRRARARSSGCASSNRPRNASGPARPGTAAPGQQAPGHGLGRLQQQADPGHRAGRRRRQRVLLRPGRHVRLLPAARRGGADGPVDAERHDRPAGRDRPAASAATRGRRSAVPAGRLPRQCARAADRGPRARPGTVRRGNFSYMAEVQPVFDKHCVALPRLRQGGRREAQPLPATWAGLQHVVRRVAQRRLRARRRRRAAPRSRRRRRWGIARQPPRQGAAPGHGKPEIDRAGASGRARRSTAILTWIDINAPYYPEYARRTPATNTVARRWNRLKWSV